MPLDGKQLVWNSGVFKGTKLSRQIKFLATEHHTTCSKHHHRCEYLRMNQETLK